MESVNSELNSETSNDVDDISNENAENLVVGRRRNRSSTFNDRIELEKKETLIRLYEEGETITGAAQISGINKNTAYSILRRYKNDGGVILNKRRGGKRMFKLTKDVLIFIESIIERNPGITLKNIKSELLQKKNLNLSTTSIFNALKTLKINLKTATYTIDRFKAIDMNLGNAVKKLTHYKCRNGRYPKSSDVVRFPVPDDKVSWDAPWNEYRPVEYTSKSIVKQSWADPPADEASFQPKWNALDGSIDRRSHFCTYKVENGVPINPVGRTGLIGRGCLGRWGPNHAADPIVTRWRRNERHEIEKDAKSQKPILQFIAIERRDSREWAIPGGMVDPGEQISVTLKREFMEEALNCLCASNSEKADLERLVNDFFRGGTEIYRGYVDDPRNTDNAWMESVATNFHDEDGACVGRLKLSAGDDAVGVKWMDLHSGLNLYASHNHFVKAVAEMRRAFW